MNMSDEIIQQLGEACNELTATSEAHSRSIDEDAAEFNSQVYTQRHGRPAFKIKEEELSLLVEEGFKIPTIARLFVVFTRTIERRMQKYGLSVSGKNIRKLWFCIVLKQLSVSSPCPLNNHISVD